MRLIDADKLEKELFNTPLWDNEDEDEFYKLINNQPTAYDIDEVVEQLEESSSFVTKEGLRLIPVVEATSIVKKGGGSDE